MRLRQRAVDAAQTAGPPTEVRAHSHLRTAVDAIMFQEQYQPCFFIDVCWSGPSPWHSMMALVVTRPSCATLSAARPFSTLHQAHCIQQLVGIIHQRSLSFSGSSTAGYCAQLVDTHMSSEAQHRPDNSTTCDHSFLHRPAAAGHALAFLAPTAAW